jgi:hypothetical protein
MAQRRPVAIREIQINPFVLAAKIIGLSVGSGAGRAISSRSSTSI